ncbi:hypothetical protein [Klebsiella pneumoniae]|uniref:hypothetical protein n=1 Tax=Klebsiella pneumoniae TaxID=573 RepID=UPI001890A8BB|nr:hypothetical protein [Klebsiella pneumoniae]
MMNNNNLQHNQFFTIEQDFSPEKITDAERLVMERFSHIYANWADEKNLRKVRISRSFLPKLTR